MIHLNYKCKVNFVKLPLIWIHLCFKAGFQKCHRRPQHRLPPGCELGELLVAASANDKPPSWVHDPASWFRKTRFTRGRVRKLKNAHNSVTVQNRTNVYINFFWSQRPRKSSPAVMSTSRETPCLYVCICMTPYCIESNNSNWTNNTDSISFSIFKIPSFFTQLCCT